MTSFKLTLLTAALALATAFTLSCSDSGGGSDPIKKAKISGVSQKGPFIAGSKATLYELNDKFEQTGRSFTDIIADDKGSFEIKNIELVSPYAMLEANGFYRNENTGEVSKAPITLFAIADVREKDQVNVNILTHLEYYRVLNLVENESMSVKDAKKQAQKEIFAVFGIDSDNFKDSEDMSIFGNTESDAALLAISVLLQGDLSEGEFSQRLVNFSKAIEDGGSWNDDGAKKDMADYAAKMDNQIQYCNYGPGNCWIMPTGDFCQSGTLVPDCSGGSVYHTTLSFIKSNILGWGLSSEVPDFGNYILGYRISGLGDCNSASESEYRRNFGYGFVCENNDWRFASWIENYFSGTEPCSCRLHIGNGNWSYFSGTDCNGESTTISCHETGISCDDDRRNLTCVDGYWSFGNTN